MDNSHQVACVLFTIASGYDMELRVIWSPRWLICGVNISVFSAVDTTVYGCRQGPFPLQFWHWSQIEYNMQLCLGGLKDVDR